MKDNECIQFLQWALPGLTMRWQGFRKVRAQVCRRVSRRMRALGSPDIAAYRAVLAANPQEWAELDAMCRITVSRFCRDRTVFDALGGKILPELAGSALARDERELRAWSAGCASGEEAYSLAIVWRLCVQPSFPSLKLRILATDSDPHMLERARRARFSASSLKDMPRAWLAKAFIHTGNTFRLRASFRESIAFVQQDIRSTVPDGPFHLILCRNLAFTYFAERLQDEILACITRQLIPGGVLVIGSHESLPPGHTRLAPWGRPPGIFRKAKV